MSADSDRLLIIFSQNRFQCPLNYVNSTMLKCKYCGNSHPKLEKAHIIPRSFFKKMRGSDKHVTELKVKENDEQKNFWQSGMHDSRIVCHDCESLFGQFDRHGHKVLTSALSQRKMSVDSNVNPRGYLIEDADYHKLKLFFLSMLWRAHASSLMFFSHVDLGSHEPTFRSHISSAKAPSSDKYEVILMHQDDSPHPLGIFPPWRVRMNKVNTYRFYLPEIVAMICVDHQSLSKKLGSGALKEGITPRLILAPFAGSPEEKHIKNIKKIMSGNIKNDS